MAIYYKTSSISLSDKMDDNEVKEVEKIIIDMVDVAILNDFDGAEIKGSILRRLPESSLFLGTPYNKYDHINPFKLLSLLKNQLKGLSSKIGITYYWESNSCIKNTGIDVIVKAKPKFFYKKERINYYNDTSFKKKLLSEHRQLMEEICTKVYWISSLCVFPTGICYYDDCPGAGISFSDFKMDSIEDSSKRYQMALALLEILNEKGYLFEGPKISFYGSSILFEIRKVNVPEKGLKQW